MERIWMTTPSWWSEVMYPGGVYSGVPSVRRCLKVPPIESEVMDAALVRSVQGLQYAFNILETGCVDARTAEFIGEVFWYGGT